MKRIVIVLFILFLLTAAFGYMAIIHDEYFFKLFTLVFGYLFIGMIVAAIKKE